MVLATAIRLEFAYPGVGVFAGDSLQYLSIATAHGVIMVFFMIMPLLFGAFANFLLPTQLGVHDVAFPRLNSAAFWFLPGGLIMLGQLICVDRRYQRMNCFNIREAQSLLRRRFFADLTNQAEHRLFLDKTMMGLKFNLYDKNAALPHMQIFFKNGLTTRASTRREFYKNKLESGFDFVSQRYLFNNHLTVITHQLQTMFATMLIFISAIATTARSKFFIDLQNTADNVTTLSQIRNALRKITCNVSAAVGTKINTTIDVLLTMTSTPYLNKSLNASRHAADDLVVEQKSKLQKFQTCDNSTSFSQTTMRRTSNVTNSVQLPFAMNVQSFVHFCIKVQNGAWNVVNVTIASYLKPSRSYKNMPNNDDVTSKFDNTTVANRKINAFNVQEQRLLFTMLREHVRTSHEFLLHETTPSLALMRIKLVTITNIVIGHIRAFDITKLFFFNILKLSHKQTSLALQTRLPLMYHAESKISDKHNATITVANGETTRLFRNYRAASPIFSYSYKSGNYFPEYSRRKFTQLFPTFESLSSGLRAQAWFFSKKFFENFNTNFHNCLTLKIEHVNNTTTYNFDIWNARTSSLNLQTVAFYNFFYQLGGDRRNFYNTRWANTPLLRRKFHKMFITSALQQRICSNW
jgi:hypothetical protein